MMLAAQNGLNKPLLQSKLAFITLATALMLIARCGHETGLSAEAIYRSIDQAFTSGNLASAEARIKSLTLNSGRIDIYWEEKLRLQRAKVLLYEGRQDALILLTQPLLDKPANSTLEITRSSLLAIAYERAGDLTRADEVLLQAQRWCASELACTEIQLSQGVVDLEKGNLPDAQYAFERCLITSRIRRDVFQQSQALLNLGVVAERLEHYDEALERFTQASAMASNLGVGLALEKATGNVGWALYKLGDYRRSLENSQLAERQAALLGAKIDQVEWLNNAGLSQFQLGDLNAAKSSYQQSYRLAVSLHNNEEIGNSLLALAYLSLQTGDLNEALRQAREVQRIAAKSGDPLDSLEPTLIEAQALARQGQKPVAKEKLLTLEQQSATLLSVRWEVEHALALLSADTGDGRAAEMWFRRAIETFRLQRSSLNSIDSRLPFFENGSSLYLDYVDYLVREGRTDDALAVLDQSRAETLAEGLGFANSSRNAAGMEAARHPQALARRLNGTILVYCLRPGSSYLWVVSPHSSGFFLLPGREAILPLVAAHNQAVLNSRDVLTQVNSPGAALYSALVEPATAFLVPGGKVFLIADEALNTLNFETLPTSGDTPHFWIEDADIVNARSIGLLAARGAARASEPGDRRLLLVGDPVYTHPEQAQLPHAAEEVARVSRQFALERRVVLTGPAATPAAYQGSHPEHYAYIHFVAHASASEMNPLDSSVILSAVPGDAEAYKLYARSILDKRLNADLVTISGCYGSGVRSYSGEGLIGLAWAFLRTGSHHVIGALWEVSDASTPQLMGDLYEGLAKGDEPDVALRSAKLAMIHGGGVFRKPFYWAAFQIYAGA